MANFADSLIAAMLEKQSQLCVGLDPHIKSIPPHLLERYRDKVPEGCGCGRREVAACFEEFCSSVIDAIAPHAAAVKLQLACFEQYGPPGMKAFKHTCDRAADAGLIVIADAKRGDIDISAAAYSAAYIGKPAGLNGPIDGLRIDALTVNPLFGTDGVQPFLNDCKEFDKGLFVLVKTSNPGSMELQDLAIAGNGFFHERVADLVTRWGSDLIGEKGYSSVGAVIGATHPETMARLRKRLPAAILLVPGIGAQGAGTGQAALAFNKKGSGALFSVSRSIIYAGSRADYAAQAAEAAQALKKELWAKSH